MKNDSKSTDRIFQLHGVPALLAPANFNVPFWLQWVAYKPINKLWLNEFVSKRANDFLET